MHGTMNLKIYKNILRDKRNSDWMSVRITTVFINVKDLVRKPLF
jgi:hypothetical protein